MKNTLVFLVTEGIGLNKKWKGNYLKLANKPNINYLISGIYPWAILANDRKKDVLIPKKSHPSVKRDVDSNFYEMFYGQTDIKTYLELLNEQIASKSLHNLDIFDKLINRSNETNSKLVHIFSMLSKNNTKLNLTNLYYIVNILIKKGLKPVLHLIGDGQEERVYSFSENLEEFSKFLLKRNTPIISLAGRNHVFGKKGHSYLDNAHVMNYFETICGLGEKPFSGATEYLSENLANQIMDANIEPAYNGLIDDCFLSKKDIVLFLNSDPDDFATLARMIKTEQKLKGIYLSSLAPIYGTEMDALFFPNPINGREDNLLTNVIAKHNNKALVLGMNHKKGFINKFFGPNLKNPNIERKVLSTPYSSTDKDYFSLSSKILIDKTIDAIGKYDVIFVLAPMIAEAARSADLNQLIATIENFDKHLGRLINFCRCTGNIIALTSAYGAAEKMLDKHLNIIPQNKSSPVPFVFTNGDLSAKKIKSNFLGVYSSILSTLESLDLDNKLFYTSLIDPNFTKVKIEENLNDAFDIWKETLSDDLIQNFEKNQLNFYSEFSKDPQFISDKQKYVVLKEIVKIHEKVLLTPETRKKLYNILIDYVEYNKIDFVGLDINYKKTFQTFFDKEIKLQKITKLSNKYFDKKIWTTNFVRNDKWINSIKFNLLQNVNRTFDLSKNEQVVNRVYSNTLPFLYFKKIQKAELEILKTNDALAITQFYELVANDVQEVFENYVANKVDLNAIDGIGSNDEEEFIEEKSDKEIENEKKLYATVSYYDYFQEVVQVVNENKPNIDLFNQKYIENINYLNEKNKEYDASNIFTAPAISLNPLTAKIVGVYKLYNNDLKNHAKSLNTENKKIVYKFDMNYKNKINLAKEAIVYEGEFDENVELHRQEEFAERFSHYANLYKEFDNVTIEWKDPESEDEENEEVELDENGNPIVVDDINERISTKPEYDLTKSWVQKRIDEHLNVDNFLEDVAVDAQILVEEERRLKLDKNKVRQYNQLSEIWKQANQISKE
ncbi:MAG: hypothetical protein K2O19_02100 [Malacoplasma sp.]|nr:hypothetical protein [Malacoplasma sp.]